MRPGSPWPTSPEVVDFVDVDAVEEVARRHEVDGALTISADRAVPVVAAVTERLGLPSIGTEVAHRMTHKIAMRRTLAEEGIPQPAFAAVRSARRGPRCDRDGRASGRAEAGRLRRPARSLPDRGARTTSSRHLHSALAESPAREAILEAFVDGTEMNGIVVARGGEARLLTLSDRLRPAGVGFGVGWIHVYPASIHADQLALAERVAERAVAALGLRDGIAFPQLIAHARRTGVHVVEVAARIPGGQMADLVRHAVGVDLVELALRFALGEDVPDEVALPRFSQPLAIRFLTAAPGPLPTGRVTRIGSLDPVLARRRRRPGGDVPHRWARRSAPSGSTATAAAT